MSLGFLQLKEGVKQSTAIAVTAFNSLAVRTVCLVLLLSLTRKIKNIPHLR